MIDRVIAKLERAAGDAADAHRHVTVVDRGCRRVPGRRRDAPCARGVGWRCEYYVPARDEVTTREVDPLRLLVVDGQSYLEAWCLLADDLRIFRLDRIQSAEVLDAPGSAASGAAARVRRSSTARLRTWRVRLALTQRAEWLLDAYPSTVVATEPELVVELSVADLGWARQLVLRLGGDVRPLVTARAGRRCRAEQRRGSPGRLRPAVSPFG